MSWWISEQVSINEANTQALVNIECDTAADLPAADQTSTAGFTIVRGSRALAVDTGRKYIMNSTGGWDIQPNEFQLDLAGYATEQYVQDELQDYATVTYVDTGLAGKISMTDILGIGILIPDYADLNSDTYTVPGVYYGNNSAGNTVLNMPVTNRNMHISLIVKQLTSVYVLQIYKSAANSEIANIYFRLKQSTWSPWYKIEATEV